MGVFMCLEEECMFPKASDKTFLDKLCKNQEGNSKHFSKPQVGSKAKKSAARDAHFEIHHYAGTVSINSENNNYSFNNN